jgi:carbon-monoxide dehydrogenase large subunit
MGSAAGDRRRIPLPSARRLVAGGGRYVANISPPGMRHAGFTRSVWPHARIGTIDPAPALAVPGVHAVFSLADLERLGVGKLPVGWVLPGQHAVSNDVLARDRVRYVGEPVAVVVADSQAAAEEGAEAVSVDYEPLTAVTDVDQALAPSAPLLHPEWGENVMARHTLDTGDVAAAFADAEVVVADRFHLGRTACAPMEGRGAVASYDRFRDDHPGQLHSVPAPCAR